MSVMQFLSVAHHEAFDAAGRRWQSRAHPSAGGTHCLEPLLQVRNLAGWVPGWYRQDGTGVGDILAVRVPDNATDSLTAASADSNAVDWPADVTIYAIAAPEKLVDRYPGGVSLLWRDVGAFLTTAHLAAAAYGVTSTLLGLCVELPDIPPVTGTTGTLPAFALGGLALGGCVAEGNPE